MKTIQAIAGSLAILALLVFLLISNVRIAFNSVGLYAYGFDKYHVSENTGIERPELVKAAAGLIEYFNSDQEPVHIQVKQGNQQIELFTGREAQHLADVKELLNRVYLWQELAAVYLVGFGLLCYLWWRRQWSRRLAGWLLWGSGAVLGVLVVMGIASAINFDAVFTQFHLISFVNDLWQLPFDSYLIRMFPEGFWFDSVMLVAGATAVEAIIIGGLSFFWLRRTRGEAQP